MIETQKINCEVYISRKRAIWARKKVNLILLLIALPNMPDMLLLQHRSTEAVEVFFVDLNKKKISGSLHIEIQIPISM